MSGDHSILLRQKPKASNAATVANVACRRMVTPAAFAERFVFTSTLLVIGISRGCKPSAGA